MFNYNNDLLIYLSKKNYNTFGLSLNDYAKLGPDAIQFLKCEYWPITNNPNTTSEINIIQEQYDVQTKILKLNRRK